MTGGAESVSLMSRPSAKGLEFPVVFIAGPGRGNLPLYLTRQPP